jgi:phage tail-like protein
LWDGQRTYFGNMQTGLFPRPEVVKHRSGGDPSTPLKSPGRNKYDSITLTRGVTQDSSFSSWAGLVSNFGLSLDSEVSLANFRKDIFLEFYNEAGQAVVGYRISGVTVHETQALPPRRGILHYLHPSGPGSISEQLAAIFQASLDRLKP